ncbi:MAG: MTH1187 family thiamine-binding protein [Dehalococcoidia bacterium]|nr:MTH1187 family thiamine-binding protein [Dehalococcoidia bacterium]
MAIIEVSVMPLGTKTPSIGQYVAEAIHVLEKEKINYELTSMGTVIEGDVDRILSVVGKMHQAAFAGGVLRVVTTIKIDDRRDKAATRESKVKSVKEKLKWLKT